MWIDIFNHQFKVTQDGIVLTVHIPPDSDVFDQLTDEEVAAAITDALFQAAVLESMCGMNVVVPHAVVEQVKKVNENDSERR